MTSDIKVYTEQRGVNEFPHSENKIVPMFTEHLIHHINPDLTPSNFHILENGLYIILFVNKNR